MLLRDIQKVWISRNNPVNNYGEYRSNWGYFGIAYLNIQQDINELDRKSSGEVDYDRYKARATKIYGIKTGDGISLSDISSSQNIVPEFRVIDVSLIGETYLIRMEKYNGD